MKDMKKEKDMKTSHKNHKDEKKNEKLAMKEPEAHKNKKK